MITKSQYKFARIKFREKLMNPYYHMACKKKADELHESLHKAISFVDTIAEKDAIISVKDDMINLLKSQLAEASYECNLLNDELRKAKDLLSKHPISRLDADDRKDFELLFGKYRKSYKDMTEEEQQWHYQGLPPL